MNGPVALAAHDRDIRHQKLIAEGKPIARAAALRPTCMQMGLGPVRGQGNPRWWRTQSLSNLSLQPQFPANREKNRELCNFGATSRIKTACAPNDFGAFRSNSLFKETGN